MINLPPADLDAFISVAETGSFRQSAELLNVSQPTISARIRHLEDILMVRLFHRTTRRVVITEAGERLRARVERMVLETRALVKEFRQEAELHGGRVVIGASPSVASGLLPSVIREYRKRWPNIDVTLRDDFFGQTLDRIKSGEVDFVVSPRGATEDSFTYQPIFTDDFKLAVASDHPLARLDTVALRDFADEPLISLPPDAAAWRTIKAAYAAVGSDFTPSLITQHAPTLISMVREQLGVGLVSGLSTRNANMSGVTTLPVSDVDLSRSICIIRSRDHEPNAATLAFLELLTKFRSSWPT